MQCVVRYWQEVIPVKERGNAGVRNATSRCGADAVFTALQAATLIAGVLGTLFALLLGWIGLTWLSIALEDHAVRMLMACGIGFAVLFTVSVMCYGALTAFFGMCGRLKRETAFTENNEQAMRRIARCFAVCAAVLALALPPLRLLIGETVLPSIYIAVIAFLFRFVALLAHALCLLVRRAHALQMDSDLTI